MISVSANLSFKKIPQVEHVVQHRFVFLHYCHWKQGSLFDEKWCSFSSWQAGSVSVQWPHRHRQRHQQCRKPTSGWYPFVSAYTCYSGVLDAAVLNATPAHRSWTLWWMGTSEKPVWSPLETCGHIRRKKEELTITGWEAFQNTEREEHEKKHNLIRLGYFKFGTLLTFHLD